MVASHNQSSIEFACSEMAQRGISKSADGVFFGQLLGMSDHLSLTLGTHTLMHAVYNVLSSTQQPNHSMLTLQGKTDTRRTSMYPTDLFNM
jgi:hypothetical protein